jgi:hypothetical protein
MNRCSDTSLQCPCKQHNLLVIIMHIHCQVWAKASEVHWAHALWLIDKIALLTPY